MSMEGKEVNPDAFAEIQNNKVNEEVISIVFAGLYKLLKLALRIPKSSLKQEVSTYRIF